MQSPNRFSVGNYIEESTMANGKVLAVFSHPVKDFAIWKSVYDSVEPIREKAGVTGAEVFQDPADHTKVVIIHRFQSIEAAQGFLANPALKEAMMNGGVTAPPSVIMAIAS
jgi:quinol monooxygenase YgiN